ncbi:hypothetical protein FRB94_003174 [Tulasnella sp. JGI-2019a]|nr:hypothetical protein FRB94_003174 [Tulasnella sp. JGI-2019a]
MPLSTIDIPTTKPSTPPRLTATVLNHPMFKQPVASTANLDHWIREQKSNASLHASQGHDYLAVWRQLDNPEQGGTPKASTSNQAGGAFASPILLPRTRKTEIKSTVTSKAVPRGVPAGVVPFDQVMSVPLREKAGSSQHTSKSVNAKDKPRDTAINVQEKENNILSFQDRDETRLAERRERRRAKREILRPPLPTSESPENESSQSSSENVPNTVALLPVVREANSKTKATSKKRKAQVMPGVALMERFSAKNVGQDRLTLRPSISTLGFLNKGKSSSAGRLPPPLIKKKKRQLKVPQESMTEFAFSKFALQPSTNEKVKPKVKPKSKKRSLSASPAKSAKRRASHKRMLVQGRADSNTSSIASESDERDVLKKREVDDKSKERHRKVGDATQQQTPIMTKASKPKSQKQRSRSTDSSLTSTSSLPSASAFCSTERVARGRNDEKNRDSHATGPRYLSPPWIIDGEVIGDVVDEGVKTEREVADAREVSPEMTRPDPVLDLRGRWGLGGVRDPLEHIVAPSNAGEEIDHRGNHTPTEPNLDAGIKDNQQIPSHRSRFFHFDHTTTKSPEPEGTATLSIKSTLHATHSVDVGEKERVSRYSTQSPLMPNHQTHRAADKQQLVYKPIFSTACLSPAPSRSASPLAALGHRPSAAIASSLLHYPFAIGLAAHASTNLRSEVLAAMSEYDPFDYAEADGLEEQLLAEHDAEDDASLMDTRRFFSSNPRRQEEYHRPSDQDMEEFGEVEFDDGGFLLVDECFNEEAGFTNNQRNSFHLGKNHTHRALPHYARDEIIAMDSYHDTDGRDYSGNFLEVHPDDNNGYMVEEDEEDLYDPEMEGFQDADDSMELYHSVGAGGRRTVSPAAAGIDGMEERGECEESDRLDDTRRFAEGRALLLGLETVHDGRAAEVNATFAHRLWRKI